MDKNSKKMNKNMPIIIAIVIIVVVAIVIFAVTRNQSNKGETVVQTSPVEQQQIDNSNKLAKIQERIDAQQKVIDDLNGKLTPLVEERTKLEQQLIELETPKPAETSEQSTPNTDMPEESGDFPEMPEEPIENTEE